MNQRFVSVAREISVCGHKNQCVSSIVLSEEASTPFCHNLIMAVSNRAMGVIFLEDYCHRICHK